MSLQDDLLRNRKVFERLTVADTGGTDSGTAFRRSAAVPEAFAPEAREPVRQNAHAQEDSLQRAETFSLTYGSRISRETGMALQPVSIGGIAFPELQQPEPPPAPDSLERLYHQLETDARRASQLFGEEEI